MKTELHFALSVLLFMLLNCILDIKYTYYDVAFSFIGWKSIGNSNWYIFDILVLYLITYIAFCITRNKHKICGILWILSIAFWIFLFCTKGSNRYWYDTILVYPLGFTFSVYKKSFDEILKKKKNYYMLLVLIIILFCAFYLIRLSVTLSISSMLFAIIIILISKQIKMGNKVLYYLETHLFEIYIFQRIPMIVLSHYKITKPCFFIGFSFLITIIIAELMTRCFSIIDKKIDAVILKHEKKENIIFKVKDAKLLWLR